MGTDTFYTSQEWLALRSRVLARDGGRCTVARLLGGACSDRLEVHHIEPRRERPELSLVADNCATCCSAHHRKWESVHAWLRKVRSPIKPCRHVHPYRSGRIACLNARRKAAGLPPVEDEQLVAIPA